MKVTIVTVVLNRRDTIHACLESVRNQRYSHIEHIIIDGGSTDGTLEVLHEYAADSCQAFVTTEPDQGIYDAINKGIKRASGDIIGFLHSDDIFSSDEAIAEVVKNLSSNLLDGCFGNCHFYYKLSEKFPIRVYRVTNSWTKLLKFGFIPPHSTLFLKRDVYKKLGPYSTEYKICGDFEYFCRMKKADIQLNHCPKYTLKMKYGGASTKSSSRRVINKEIHEILSAHNIQNFRFLIYLRYILKIFEIKPRAFLKLR
ncbi:glycosyltransferase family 2 protein [Rhodobacteraceae bacterium nBUS_22]